MSLFITDHAIRRFQQRFERTSYESAKLGIEAMVKEARGLSLVEVMTLRQHGSWNMRNTYLFHDYTKLLVVMRFGGNVPSVITVFRPHGFGLEDAA